MTRLAALTSDATQETDAREPAREPPGLNSKNAAMVPGSFLTHGISLAPSLNLYIDKNGTYYHRSTYLAISFLILVLHPRLWQLRPAGVQLSLKSRSPPLSDRGP